MHLRIEPGLRVQTGYSAAIVLRRVWPLVPLCALAACGGGGRRVASSYSPQSYAAPGPPSDPWGPYINEASRRFTVPQSWIRAVMHQESGGHEYMRGQPITSDAGATGLMQVMPATYAELAGRFNLGPDPYEPHDNILAGTGYIKDLYDRYGSPNFLAAYNAGPHRLDAYLAGHGALPNETVNYVASIAPSLSQDRPLTGPLAVYADSGRFPATQDPVPRAYARSPAARCWQDPDAAYDPDAPCRSAPPMRVAAAAPVPLPVSSGWARNAPAPVPIALTRPAPPHAARCWHDPDAAYDPDAPCRPAPVPYTPPSVPPGRITTPSIPAPVPYAPPVREAARSQSPDWQRLLAVPAQRQAPPSQVEARRYASSTLAYAAASVRPAMATGRWGIQIGAYTDAGQARRMAESVRSLAPRELGGAQAVLGTTAPFGGRVLYRARLVGLSPQTASAACSKLSAAAQTCVTVRPGG